MKVSMWFHKITKQKQQYLNHCQLLLYRKDISVTYISMWLSFTHYRMSFQVRVWSPKTILLLQQLTLPKDSESCFLISMLCRKLSIGIDSISRNYLFIYLCTSTRYNSLCSILLSLWQNHWQKKNQKEGKVNFNS